MSFALELLLATSFCGLMLWLALRSPAVVHIRNRDRWPTCPAGEPLLNRPCQFVGVVRSLDRAYLLSPISQSTCVVWHVREYEPKASGDGLPISTKETDVVPFEVVDDAGCALLVPKPIALDKLFVEPNAATIAECGDRLDMRVLLQAYGAKGNVEWSETVLSEGDRVALFGVCIKLAQRVVFEPDTTGYATVEIVAKVDRPA